jgi:hypothetical protein
VVVVFARRPGHGERTSQEASRPRIVSQPEPAPARPAAHPTLRAATSAASAVSQTRRAVTPAGVSGSALAHNLTSSSSSDHDHNSASESSDYGKFPNVEELLSTSRSNVSNATNPIVISEGEEDEPRATKKARITPRSRPGRPSEVTISRRGSPQRRNSKSVMDLMATREEREKRPEITKRSTRNQRAHK